MIYAISSCISYIQHPRWSVAHLDCTREESKKLTKCWTSQRGSLKLLTPIAEMKLLTPVNVRLLIQQFNYT